MDKKYNICVYHGNDIIHYGNYKIKPDCKTCDGYGKDSKKNNWDCYVSLKTWMDKKIHQEKSKQPSIKTLDGMLEVMYKKLKK